MQRFRDGYRVQIRDSSGQMISKTFNKGQKDLAQQFEQKIRDERRLVRAGLEKPASDILLLDHFASWMKLREKTGEVTPSTLSGQDTIFRLHIPEAFHRRPMATISSEEWKAHFAELLSRDEKPLSVASVNRVRALLHKLYKDALIDGKVVFNPISRIPLRKERVQKQRVIWTEEQREAYIKGMYADNPYAGLFAVISVFVGPRKSEIMALRNRSFDTEQCLLWFTEILEQCSGEIVPRTKGDVSGRAAPLFERVAKAYAEHMKTHPHHGPDDFVFAATQDPTRPLRALAMNRAHERVIKRLGLPRTTPHGNRHLCSTIAEDAGFSIYERKELLGHSTVAMTERYTHMNMRRLVEKAKQVGFATSRKRRVKAVKQ